MTTEKKYPVKECDYCDHVGMAYTSMAGETMCKSCLSELPSDAAECRKLIVEQRKRIAELETELDKAYNDLANFEGYPEEVSALRHDIERRKQRYLNLLNKRKEWKKRAESVERELDDSQRKLSALSYCIKNQISSFYDARSYEEAVNAALVELNKFAIEQQIKAIKNAINNCRVYNEDVDAEIVFTDALWDEIEQLRQQLNGGE